MPTVDQFLKALAVTESNDDPEAWGDGGQAMGRWQVHPARLWQDMHTHGITPTLSDTWDQLVARVLRAMYAAYEWQLNTVVIAMYWHKGHFVIAGQPEWDATYAARFNAALAHAIEEMP